MYFSEFSSLTLNYFFVHIELIWEIFRLVYKSKNELEKKKPWQILYYGILIFYAFSRKELNFENINYYSLSTFTVDTTLLELLRMRTNYTIDFLKYYFHSCVSQTLNLV